MPGIKAVLETSFLDWRGRVCAVLFLGGCNFRCPFCHNHSLVLTPGEYETISVEAAARQLAPFRKWLGGICITGGEPTLDPDLAGMIRFLKDSGWPVKLDTNGSRPEVLAELLAAGLLDAVAMDVKAPLDPEKYSGCAGVPVDLGRIRESIRLLGESGIEHEFRMTVVPRYHTRDDIAAWAAALGPGPAKLTLQNFNPRTTLDPELGREKGFAAEVFESFRTLVEQAGKNARLA
ncbi:MAG: anaerobic ribonucleoside-triphosphate reductase activating protein [Desulfobacteraceae bacterium]|nr:anaerobic ribonucleoside-triphosphate reductase activating protein [Desulfobacteraceae bacterium]